MDEEEKEYIDQLKEENELLKQQILLLKEHSDSKTNTNNDGKIDEKKIELETYHSNPNYYKEKMNYEKEMTRFRLKYSMYLTLGIIVFMIIFVLTIIKCTE